MRHPQDNPAAYAALAHAAARNIEVQRRVHEVRAAVGERDKLAWIDQIHREAATVHMALLGDDPEVAISSAVALASCALGLADHLQEQHG